MSNEYKFETIQVHGGHTPDGDTHSRAVPMYLFIKRRHTHLIARNMPQPYLVYKKLEIFIHEL